MAIIDEAIAVIDNLPNEETLKLSDAKKVEEARALVNKALDAGIVKRISRILVSWLV